MATGRGLFDSTQKIVTNGLVLHLDAGLLRSYARGGATTWYDMAGSNDNFTLYNGASFSTSNGGEIRFDGVNDYARMRSSVSLPQMLNNGTVELWIRSLANGDTFGTAAYGRALSVANTTGTGGDTAGTASGTQNDYTNYFCILKNNTANHLSFYCGRDTNGGGTGPIGFWYSNSNGTVVDDALYRQMIFTWSSSGTSRTFNQYTNNSFVGTQTYTGNNIMSSDISTCTLGMVCNADSNGGGNTAMAMGVLRFYNRALTATEIAQNWTLQRTRFGR